MYQRVDVMDRLHLSAFISYSNETNGNQIGKITTSLRQKRKHYCFMWHLYTPVTEKRPTCELGVGSDVALVLVETWNRPIVVARCAGPVVTGRASFRLSDSQISFARGDERWRVFSGLEGEEEDEEDDEVEDDVKEEEPEGSGTFLDVSSVATDTCS